MANDEGDRQPDQNNVNAHSRDVSRHGMACGRERERHDHPIHENVNRDSVKQSRHNGVLCQRTEFPAGGVEHRRRCKRDQEVNGETQPSGRRSSLERSLPEQTARDSLQHSSGSRTFDLRDHKRGGDIENSGDQTSRCDCRKSARSFHRSRY